jgi:hypothetical protein
LQLDGRIIVDGIGNNKDDAATGSSCFPNSRPLGGVAAGSAA